MRDFKEYGIDIWMWPKVGAAQWPADAHGKFRSDNHAELAGESIRISQKFVGKLFLDN